MTTVGNTITVFAFRSKAREEFNVKVAGVIVDDIYEFLITSLFLTFEASTGLLSKAVTRLGFFLEMLKL